jgi:hypothetical protein
MMQALVGQAGAGLILSLVMGIFFRSKIRSKK